MGIGRGVLCVLLPALAQAQFTQQGGKLVGTGAAKSLGTCTLPNGALAGGGQGSWVSLSADGNTMISSAQVDPPHGAAWVFTRSNGTWSQQGSKLLGSNYQGTVSSNVPVAISADGNTAAMANSSDNSNQGAVWFFTRSNGVWNQQGPKVSGTGATALSSPGCQAGGFNLCPGAEEQGFSIAISADGNTLIEGGPLDANNGLTFAGAAWIFTRSNGAWSQQGNKLVGSGVEPFAPSLINAGASQGQYVAISADGNTAVVGGPQDGATGTGAVWTFSPEQRRLEPARQQAGGYGRRGPDWRRPGQPCGDFRGREHAGGEWPERQFQQHHSNRHGRGVGLHEIEWCLDPAGQQAGPQQRRGTRLRIE